MKKSVVAVGLVVSSLFASCGSPQAGGPSREVVSGEKTVAPALDTLSAEERPFVRRWRIDMSKIAARAAEAAKSGKGMSGYGEAMAYLPSFMLDVRADHTVLLSGVNHVGTGTWSVSGDTMSFKGPRVLNVARFTLNGGVAKMNTEKEFPGEPDHRYEMIAVERGPMIDTAALPGTWVMDMRASAASMKRMAERTDEMMRAMTGTRMDRPIGSVEEYETQLGRMMKNRATLQLNADGTGVMNNFGGSTAFTWVVWDDMLVLTETKTGQGEPTVLTLANTVDGLEIEMGMMSMVFKKK